MTTQTITAGLNAWALATVKGRFDRCRGMLDAAGRHVPVAVDVAVTPDGDAFAIEAADMPVGERGRMEPRHVVRRVQERGAEPDGGPAGAAPAQPVAALIVWSNSSSPPSIV